MSGERERRQSGQTKTTFSHSTGPTGEVVGNHFAILALAHQILVQVEIEVTLKVSLKQKV